MPTSTTMQGLTTGLCSDHDTPASSRQPSSSRIISTTLSGNARPLTTGEEAIQPGRCSPTL